jgi:ABC-2 type transport system permease protein
VRSIWPVASGVAWRTLKNVMTTPSIMLPSLMFPLLFFAAFAGGLSQVQNTPGFDYPNGYTAFQFVFVLLQSAAFGGVFTGFGVARDFEGGFARRLMLAAPNRVGILVGYGLASLLRWCITAVLLTVIALVVGMQVGGGPVDVIGLYTLAAIMNACGFLWAAGIATRLRTIQAGPLMQMPVFLLLFIAPVYVPLALLGGAMHTLARFNPATYALEAGRGFLSGDPTDVALGFGLPLAAAIVFSIWALRGLRSAEAAG